MKGTFVIPVFLILILSGCNNYLTIERNENIQFKSGEIKLVCIDPTFFYEKDQENYQLKDRESMNEKLRKDIVKFSRKNNIDLGLHYLNESAKASFYTDLLALKSDLIASNFKQQTPYNYYQRRKNKNTVNKKVFVYAPKVSYEFNALSKLYGTPYFSYMGIYQNKDKTILYHIVVDTDLSETVYREYRSVKGGLKKGLMGQMIYDSYFTLKKELSKKNK